MVHSFPGAAETQCRKLGASSSRDVLLTGLEARNPRSALDGATRLLRVFGKWGLGLCLLLVASGGLGLETADVPRVLSSPSSVLSGSNILL